LDNHRVKAFVERADEAMALCSFLLQMTGGQAGRTPQLTSLLLANVETSRREVYVDDTGSVFVVPDYDKVRSVQLRRQRCARFLDNKSSALFIFTVAFVRPIYETLLKLSLPDKTVDKQLAFLSVGRALDVERARKTFKRLYLEHVKVGFACLLFPC
jgi:hypothetical protein